MSARESIRRRISSQLKSIVLVFSAVAGAMLCVRCLVAAEPPRPPNVIVILVDDLGWTDVACFGSKFYQTPNIDRLTAEGVKFTNAYASCTVCSPTRASLLTGQYPARLHITDWIPGYKRPKEKLKPPEWTQHLPLDEPNLAKTLHQAGYASASIGKWHLGGPDFYPDRQGFDLNIAGTEKGQPPSYFSPYHIPTLTDGPEGEFLTDRESAEALKFIESHQKQPFFIYLAHHAVHQPIAGKDAVVEKYRKLAKADNPQHDPIYAALIESVDDSVGRVLAKLDELKLAEQTIVIFTSDNGGLLRVTANLGIRAGKGSAYEGGVRVPMAIRWPKHFAPAVSDAPVISADLYPTILELTGVADAPSHIIDGKSLVPILRQTGQLRRDAIYWHYPHYHPGGATPYSALRAGSWKLIEFFEDHHRELYNLKDDLSESHDLAATMPEKTAELGDKLDRWRKSVKAQLPTANEAAAEK